MPYSSAYFRRSSPTTTTLFGWLRRFHRSVMDVRQAMETQPSELLTRHSSAMSDIVSTSIVRTALVGSLLTLAVSVFVAFWAPNILAMVVAVALASFLFMMTTLVTYKLDYIGYRGHA